MKDSFYKSDILSNDSLNDDHLLTSLDASLK